MHRIRIVIAPFRADTFAQLPTESREFVPETWLVLLRHEPENRSTFFALISDIPSVQSVPLRRLPEYVADTDTFERSTRRAT